MDIERMGITTMESAKMNTEMKELRNMGPHTMDPGT
jgi:hypothetical protein